MGYQKTLVDTDRFHLTSDISAEASPGASTASAKLNGKLNLIAQPTDRISGEYTVSGTLPVSALTSTHGGKPNASSRLFLQQKSPLPVLIDQNGVVRYALSNSGDGDGSNSAVTAQFEKKGNQPAKLRLGYTVSEGHDKYF